MPPNHSLSIRFAANGTAHDDLTVRLGAFERISDSYYLVDEVLCPPQLADVKARQALNDLLGQWLARVQSLGDGEAVLLPFDFQDEWIGCFRATLRQGGLELEPGDLDENGYCLDLSNLEKLFSHQRAFFSRGEVVRLDLSAFRLAILEAQRALSNEG